MYIYIRILYIYISHTAKDVDLDLVWVTAGWYLPGQFPNDWAAPAASCPDLEMSSQMSSRSRANFEKKCETT